MHMLVTVLGNPSKLKQVLKAYNGLGIGQSVVVDGLGTSNFDNAYESYRPALESTLLSVSEVAHYRKVVLSVVHREADIEKAMDAAEKLLGSNMKKPNTGIIFAIPMVNL